jgi:hypothetical protein
MSYIKIEISSAQIREMRAIEVVTCRAFANARRDVWAEKLLVALSRL